MSRANILAHNQHEYCLVNTREPTFYVEPKRTEHRIMTRR